MEVDKITPILHKISIEFESQIHREKQYSHYLSIKKYPDLRFRDFTHSQWEECSKILLNYYEEFEKCLNVIEEWSDLINLLNKGCNFKDSSLPKNRLFGDGFFEPCNDKQIIEYVLNDVNKFVFKTKEWICAFIEKEIINYPLDAYDLPVLSFKNFTICLSYEMDGELPSNKLTRLLKVRSLLLSSPEEDDPSLIPCWWYYTDFSLEETALEIRDDFPSLISILNFQITNFKEKHNLPNQSIDNCHFEFTHVFEIVAITRERIKALTEGYIKSHYNGMDLTNQEATDTFLTLTQLLNDLLDFLNNRFIDPCNLTELIINKLEPISKFSYWTAVGGKLTPDLTERANRFVTDSLSVFIEDVKISIIKSTQRIVLNIDTRFYEKGYTCMFTNAELISLIEKSNQGKILGQQLAQLESIKNCSKLSYQSFRNYVDFSKEGAINIIKRDESLVEWINQKRMNIKNEIEDSRPLLMMTKDKISRVGLNSFTMKWQRILSREELEIIPLDNFLRSNFVFFKNDTLRKTEYYFNIVRHDNLKPLIKEIGKILNTYTDSTKAEQTKWMSFYFCQYLSSDTISQYLYRKGDTDF